MLAEEMQTIAWNKHGDSLSEYTLEEFCFLQALCWGKLTSKEEEEEEEKQEFTIMFQILHNSHICVAFTNTVTSAAITSETVTSEPRL